MPIDLFCCQKSCTKIKLQSLINRAFLNSYISNSRSKVSVRVTSDLDLYLHWRLPRLLPLYARLSMSAVAVTLTSVSSLSWCCRDDDTWLRSYIQWQCQWVSIISVRSTTSCFLLDWLIVRLVKVNGKLLLSSPQYQVQKYFCRCETQRIEKKAKTL